MMRPVDLFAAKLKPAASFGIATDDPTYLTWSLMVMQRHHARNSNGWPKGRRISSTPRAAGSKPATAPSRAAKAAAPIIFAIAGLRES